MDEVSVVALAPPDPDISGKVIELRNLVVRAQKVLDELLSPEFFVEPGSIRVPLESHRLGKQQAMVLEEAYRRVTIGDVYVDLRKHEMKLIRALMDADRPLSAAEILDALYPNGPKPDIRIIAVHLCNLRKKLRPLCGGKDPIQTLRGLGFKLHLDILMGRTPDEPTVMTLHSSSA
jgi:DNA-binding response OmpR family regulator